MTFRNKLLTAIAPLALILPGCAQANRTVVAASDDTPATLAEVNRADADPALWVIKDEDTTIYLFGTIHLLKPDLVWFDDAVADAFNASGELVLEMIEPDPATMQGIVMNKAVATDGIALRDRLTDEQRTKYDATMTSLGIPPAAFDRFEPWMAAITISILPAQKMGFDPNQGVEKIVAKKAKDKALKIDAVETAEQQLGLFDTLPMADQVTYLMAVIDGLPEYEDTMTRMEATWATGDVAGLGKLMTESMTESPTLSKILLADRNERWAAWLDDRMDAPGIVFMAVGAGHLAGKDSVQDFLAKRNITAKRIDY